MRQRSRKSLRSVSWYRVLRLLVYEADCLPLTPRSLASGRQKVGISLAGAGEEPRRGAPLKVEGQTLGQPFLPVGEFAGAAEEPCGTLFLGIGPRQPMRGILWRDGGQARASGHVLPEGGKAACEADATPPARRAAEVFPDLGVQELTASPRRQRGHRRLRFSATNPAPSGFFAEISWEFVQGFHCAQLQKSFPSER